MLSIMLGERDLEPKRGAYLRGRELIFPSPTDQPDRSIPTSDF